MYSAPLSLYFLSIFVPKSLNTNRHVGERKILLCWFTSYINFKSRNVLEKKTKETFSKFHLQFFLYLYWKVQTLIGSDFNDSRFLNPWIYVMSKYFLTTNVVSTKIETPFDPLDQTNPPRAELTIVSIYFIIITYGKSVFSDPFTKQSQQIYK